MKTGTQIFFRLLALPFFFAMVAIAAIRDTLWLCGLWIRFGGEMIPHRKRPTGIHDVYVKLEKFLEKQPA